MIDTSWRIEDPDPVESHGRQHLERIREPALPPLGAAAALAGLGGHCGRRHAAGDRLDRPVPMKGQGTVTLLLAHDPGTDPAVAMSTDVSLLRTRTVAQTAIDDLGLEMTPEVFQETVAVTPVTSSVMQIDVAGPDDASAVARASALSEAYLDFRGTQMASQSQALIDGYQEQVDGLKAQAARLTRPVRRADRQGRGQPEPGRRRADPAGRGPRADQPGPAAHRGHRPCSPAPSSRRATCSTRRAPYRSRAMKRTVINTMAGLIGGLAIGIGLVLFQALTSGRLRRRDEVALALAAPVRFSAGQHQWAKVVVASAGEAVLTRAGPGGPRPGARVRGCAAPKGRQARLALVAVDDAADAALVAASAGRAPRRHGEGRLPGGPQRVGTPRGGPDEGARPRPAGPAPGRAGRLPAGGPAVPSPSGPSVPLPASRPSCPRATRGAPRGAAPTWS